jgi:hypothetical protein
MGDLAVENLTREKLTTWRNAVAAARPASNEDEARKHKATANRTLTILKAARICIAEVNLYRARVVPLVRRQQPRYGGP